MKTKSKKLSKKKSKELKNLIKINSFNNLKESIKNLPIDIQRIIYFICIKETNKLNLKIHKTIFHDSLNNFKLDHINIINDDIKKDGKWCKFDDLSVKYNPNNNICKKDVHTEYQENTSSVEFDLDTVSDFNVPSHRKYSNTEKTYWFHHKCRCSDCDKVKIACCNTNTKFRTYIKQPKYKFYKDFKNIEFNSDGTWNTSEKFLDSLYRLFRLDTYTHHIQHYLINNNTDLGDEVWPDIDTDDDTDEDTDEDTDDDN